MEMNRDCSWLKSHDLMDYSLIVGIHEEATKGHFEEGQKGAVVRPGVGFVYQVSDSVFSETFIGIIGKRFDCDTSTRRSGSSTCTSSTYRLLAEVGAWQNDRSQDQVPGAKQSND